MTWGRKVQMSEYKRVSTQLNSIIWTIYLHLQHYKPLPPLHYICNLHLGAIVLNIINISVTAKNGSFFINMASHMSYTLRAETFAHRNFRELIKFAKVSAHNIFGKWSFAKVYAREKFENRD